MFLPLIFTQNQRINQVSDKTLIIGFEIASENNYTGAFNWGGLEQGKIFKFFNNLEGIQAFKEWTAKAYGKAPYGQYLQKVADGKVIKEY